MEFPLELFELFEILPKYLSSRFFPNICNHSWEHQATQVEGHTTYNLLALSKRVWKTEKLSEIGGKTIQGQPEAQLSLCTSLALTLRKYHTNVRSEHWWISVKGLGTSFSAVPLFKSAVAKKYKIGLVKSG